MDAVDPSRGLLLTAQGLLMYLRPREVHGLIAACARRFPGATLVLDAVPPWFSERTLQGIRTASGYQPPPMPCGIDAAERKRLGRLAGVARLAAVRLPRRRGAFFGLVAPMLGARPLRYLAPWTVRSARFSAA